MAHVPVEITEIDSEGKQKSEQTFIEDVSDFGCRFSTRWPVRQGDTVALKILGPHGNKLPGEERQFYEIMWVARNEHRYTAGARLLKGEKLAGVKFPPENSGPINDPK